VSGNRMLRSKRRFGKPAYWGRRGFITGIPHQIIIINIIFFFSVRYPALATLSSGFETCNVLREEIARSSSNLRPEGPGIRIYDPRRQGDPSIGLP